MDALARHRLHLLDLDPGAVGSLPVDEGVDAVYRRFLERVPYENFSALARRLERPADPASWPRGTDRLLDECRRLGLGGTCFSMAYALSDLLRGIGANAHAALAHHLRKDEPHAVVLVYGEGGPRLFDPSYFMGAGLPVWPGSSLDDGLFRWTLAPRRGPLLEMVQTTRVATRATLYSLVPTPAPPDGFRRLWVEAIRSLNVRPGRLARRVGDEVRWYGEPEARIDVIAPSGRREIPVGPHPAQTLAEWFGVDEGALRCHFAAAGTR